MFTGNGKHEIQGEKFSSKWKTWSGAKNSHLPIAINAMLNPSIIMKFQGIDETFFSIQVLKKNFLKRSVILSERKSNTCLHCKY